MSLCPHYLHGTCLCFSSTLFKVTETEFNSDEYPMRRGRGRPRGSVYYVEYRVVLFEGAMVRRTSEGLRISFHLVDARSLPEYEIFLKCFLLPSSPCIACSFFALRYSSGRKKIDPWYDSADSDYEEKPARRGRGRPRGCVPSFSLPTCL